MQVRDGKDPSTERAAAKDSAKVKEVAALVKAIDAYPTPVTRGALKLAMLTAMRPGILASARWDEIDLKAAEWQVPGSRMKRSSRHTSFPCRRRLSRC